MENRLHFLIKLAGNHGNTGYATVAIVVLSLFYSSHSVFAAITALSQLLEIPLKLASSGMVSVS